MIETDLNTDFDPPLDYKEPEPQPKFHKTKSTKEREIKEIETAKVDAIANKMKRLDGRAMTEA